MKIYKDCLEVNKSNIFKFVSPADIYLFYLPKLKFNKIFSSPLRIDKSPSFIIYDKSYYFKDFGTGEQGDCFTFIKELYNINYNEALKQIIYDMNLSEYFDVDYTKIISTKKGKVEKLIDNKSNNTKATISVKIRDFNEDDKKYWNKYGISLKTLQRGNVFAISHFFLNKQLFIAEKYAYVYIENKDNKITYKIYQPYSKNKKWLNSNNYSIWELWHLLPKTHDNIIITSSRKDALSIIENVKIPSTAFQSETIVPKEHVIKDIIKRFKNVYILFDNDYTKETNWGQKHAKNLIKKYNLTNIVIPEVYKVKDFSDLVYEYGRAQASAILKKLINEK